MNKEIDRVECGSINGNHDNKLYEAQNNLTSASYSQSTEPLQTEESQNKSSSYFNWF